MYPSAEPFVGALVEGEPEEIEHAIERLSARSLGTTA